MLKINFNNDVYLTKGDSADIGIKIVRNEKPYIIQNGDVIRGQVRKHYDTDVLFTMDIRSSDPENIVWHVRPSDTEDLPTGTYVYDIELVSGEDIYTISSGNLYLTKEVSRF